MDDETILKKAIEKAEKNGFELPSLSSENIFNMEYKVQWWFSHDFAKAFFGEYPLPNDSHDQTYHYLWEKHLQQMVLEEEPLQYLKQFLNE